MSMLQQQLGEISDLHEHVSEQTDRVVVREVLPDGWVVVRKQSVADSTTVKWLVRNGGTEAVVTRDAVVTEPTIWTARTRARGEFPCH